MSNRNQRKVIAKETLSIQDNGSYTTSEGNTIEIADIIQNCNEHSRVSTEADFNTLSGKGPDMRCSNGTKIEVTTEYSITSCLRLSAEFADGEKVLCLNFASAKNVCGGMVGGSLAQEESLGLCSCLYSSLSQFQNEYYQVNKRNPKDGLYHNILMYSPDCLIIREDKNYQLLESPSKVTFISCPAVNKGVATNKGVKPDVISEAMRQRIHHVLAVAADSGHKNIILGAWGCGVFRNDPHEIANQFWEFIGKPNGLFHNVFQRIVFAVGSDERVLNPFRNVFTCN